MVSHRRLNFQGGEETLLIVSGELLEIRFIRLLDESFEVFKYSRLMGTESHFFASVKGDQLGNWG